ncbi:hypothetical protein T06_15685 [Trichinella sp. T6]|nr:hypothetical protein T06_15685 [Trichinella sp. T6]
MAFCCNNLKPESGMIKFTILGHISRDCHSHTGSQHGRDEPQYSVSNTNHNIPIIVVQSPITNISLVEGSMGGRKCKMLVYTGAAVTQCSRGGYEGIEGFKASPETFYSLGNGEWR